MEYIEEYRIKANNTLLVLGRIKHLYIEDTIIEKFGFVDLAKGNIGVVNGLDSYAFPNTNKRLEYQRPKE